MNVRQARAWRLGLFVAIGLALAAGVASLLLGRTFFIAHEEVRLVFAGSVNGLRSGAPVSFRGVPIGQVADIVLARPPAAALALRAAAAPASAASAAVGAPTAPVATGPQVEVSAELDRAALQALLGGVSATGPELVQALVRRGLRARLATQSLLTGQLFVEMDWPDAPPAAVAGAAFAAAAPMHVPTQPNTMQSVQAQLDRVDLGALVEDLRGAAAGARRLVADAPLKPALEDVRALAADMRRLLARVDEKVLPLTDSARAAFSEARGAAERWGAVAAPVTATAERWGGAASEASRTLAQVRGLAAPDAAITRAAEAARRAADELAATAAALRGSVGASAPLVTDLDRTAREVGDAARAVRALADLLEKHPNALIFGRPSGAPRPETQPDYGALR